MIRVSLAAASLAVLAACASDPVEPLPPANAAEPPAAAADAMPESAFERAMITVDGLVEVGDTQTAIDRLTQLLGDPALSDEEKAKTLLQRGELRFSESGYDVFGSIEDFEEIVTDYPRTSVYPEANEMLGVARGKATSLNFLAEQPGASRDEVFNALFALGEHEDAIKHMTDTGYTPSNDHLVAMYQIGYLCEDEELTGPVYQAADLEGTERNLQFCDLGK